MSGNNGDRRGNAPGEFSVKWILRRPYAMNISVFRRMMSDKYRRCRVLSYMQCSGAIAAGHLFAINDLLRDKRRRKSAGDCRSRLFIVAGAKATSLCSCARKRRLAALMMGEMRRRGRVRRIGERRAPGQPDGAGFDDAQCGSAPAALRRSQADPRHTVCYAQRLMMMEVLIPPKAKLLLCRYSQSMRRASPMM